ncbi:MAG TPA: amidohydrolase family protein [Sphingomonadaceae bacterium]|nr:amidohydrolase family protein [Sphingomonadaceae bacterium]
MLAAGSAKAEPVVYAGGQIWSGDGWVARDVAVNNGRIIDAGEVPAEATRVDVSGKFVTPAYGNAHAHVTNPTPDGSRSYTDVGVFYVWNPTTVVIGPEGRAFFERSDAYDVVVSQGGITEPGGHPERLYVEYLAKPVYGGKPREWFVGNAFHYGSTPAQIDAALDKLKEQGAQFVKAYLLNSERYQTLKSDPKAYGSKGLNPINMPYLVAQAHRRGLPVAVHVETAHDLRMAAWAGVDIAAHLPGYSGGTGAKLEAKRLSEADAELVAKSGMVVIPTYALIRGDAYGAATGGLKPETRDAARLQAENLQRLRAAGAPVLIGTDGRGEIFTEAEHLVEIGAMTDAQTAAVALNTAALMFTERRVGCLQTGCEADFLVLGADPAADVRNLRRIERRIMQGRELPAPESKN